MIIYGLFKFQPQISDRVPIQKSTRIGGKIVWAQRKLVDKIPLEARPKVHVS